MDENNKKVKRQLSASILLRGLGQEEYERILGIYNKNKKQPGFRGDRTIALSVPLTYNEQKALFDFLNTRDSIKDILNKYDLKGTTYTIIKRIALRYLYQNRELLK